MPQIAPFPLVYLNERGVNPSSMGPLRRAVARTIVQRLVILHQSQGLRQ
ncbi:hypothetical protein P775_18450 [Puniceibacterium antarcticum]|uniref:Uncharacterized protein n=1 Tax=Puniceibacterium antarcticum TaxID=1206336 RepID=A0A2G8RAG6_9RHOB|nr:hypothetical protein P775_18450 [Puniceibacterium antarcticum]